jgi:hypothetical protein
MYNIIQMRFQEDLIPRIIAQTPHMTICFEIRSTIFSCPEPQLWNSPTTKEYIANWKLHVNEILEKKKKKKREITPTMKNMMKTMTLMKKLFTI